MNSDWQHDRNMQTWLARARAGALGAATRVDDQEVVFEELGVASRLAFLAEGCVELLVRWAGGDSRVWCLVPSPCLIGGTELAGGLPSYLGTARSVGPSQLHWLDADQLRLLVNDDAALAREALADQCAQHGVTAIAALFPLAGAEQRLATLLGTYLGVIGEPDGARVTLPIKRTQADLAALAGLSPRSVSRVLAGWQKDDVVVKVRGYFSVDPALLWFRGGELARRAQPLLAAWTASRIARAGAAT
ncbi:MAG: Crp/Fnr family transcriptional regulator [Myxococcota bacterium]